MPGPLAWVFAMIAPDLAKGGISAVSSIATSSVTWGTAAALIYYLAQDSDYATQGGEAFETKIYEPLRKFIKDNINIDMPELSGAKEFLSENWPMVTGGLLLTGWAAGDNMIGWGTWAAAFFLMTSQALKGNLMEPLTHSVDSVKQTFGISSGTTPSSPKVEKTISPQDNREPTPTLTSSLSPVKTDFHPAPEPQFI